MSDKKIRMFIEDDFLFLTETPDQISVGSDHEKKELFSFNTGGAAFPFGYYKNKMVIGQEGNTHGQTASQDRAKMQYPGRIWTTKKVISFWVYPPKGKLKKVLKDIENTFNNIPLDRFGSDDFPDYDEMYPNKLERSYHPKQPKSRGDDYGKIKIDNGWRLDIPAETGQSYNDFANSTGNKEIAPRYYAVRGYLYSLKTVYSGKPLKGAGKDWNKGVEVSSQGVDHIKPAMLKKGAIKKLDKKGKEDLYNYFKDKGRLNPAEKRMWRMINKEGIDVYFDGTRFMFQESEVRDELNTHDSHQVEMGMKVEKEHDNGDLDVINSEEDLLKVVLAHLREDPKYYTKLKKVEESNTKTFTLEEGTGILTEAPHIVVGDKAIDFEFEKDKVAGLKKIIKAIMKQEITDKYGSKFKLSIMEVIL